MIKSLKQQGICEEARRKISRPNLDNPSEENTTIHEIATELYDYVWKELMFDRLVWLNYNPGSSLGVLAAAAKSVSSGLCPSLGESAVASSQQGNSTTLNTQNHLQQTKLPFIDSINHLVQGYHDDNIGFSFSKQPPTQPFIDPTSHAVQRYYDNNMDCTTQPFIDPTSHAVQRYYDDNINHTFRTQQANPPLINPTFCTQGSNVRHSNSSIIGQSADLPYAQSVRA